VAGSQAGNQAYDATVEDHSMSERIWDAFLTEQDRARGARQPAQRKGAGHRPAVLLVDLYRWVFGDEPAPLLEAIETWPGSTGLSGWEALPHIQRLLGEARRLGIPVVHISGSDGMPGWRDPHPRHTTEAPALAERRRRRYDIVDEVAPIEGEVVLRKVAPSAFWGTPLVGHLINLGVDTVVVAGESTSGCVRATCVDAKSYRFRVLIPEPCVFDRDQASHAINLYDLDQKYADVLPLEEVLDYLAGVAPQR
jgi:nicotinamidase-related amidase